MPYSAKDKTGRRLREGLRGIGAYAPFALGAGELLQFAHPEQSRMGIRRRIRGLRYLRQLRERDLLTEFREEDWMTMVDHMVVYSKDDIRVIFKDGSEIKAGLNDG